MSRAVRRADDFFGLRLPGSPTLSPDGRQAIVSLQTIGRDAPADAGGQAPAPKYRRQLWSITPSEDGPAGTAPLMEDRSFDTAPTFSPDGSRLAFLSNREGRKQAFICAPDGTGARALARPDAFDGAVADVVWLDADRLLLVVEVPPADAPATPEDAVEVSWLRYKRDGDAKFLESGSALWLVTAGEEGADPRLLYTAAGKIGSLVVSDADAFLVVEAIHSDLMAPPSEIHRLRLGAALEGTAGPEDTLLWSSPSSVTALAVTGNSQRVVAVTSATAEQSAVPPAIWVLAEGAQPAKGFAGADYEVERSVGGDSRHLGGSSLLYAVPGGDEVVFAVTTDLEVALFAGDPTEPTARRLTPEGLSLADFSEVCDGRLLACLESSDAPSECFLVSLDAATAPERLSAFNAAWLAGKATVRAEAVEIEASDGLRLRGILYRSPADPDGSLIIKIHGGPHAAVGNTFDNEVQLWLDAGYNVLLPNIRGSAGRGTEYRGMSVSEWGRKDYADLSAFADWAVAEGAGAEGHLYVLGGSYGGFLVNWILTQTDRFRAAVSERSISNFLSKFGTADNGATTNRFELGGADLFDESCLTMLWERSPLKYAPEVVTPVLFIHGELDYRCPIEQAEQFFTALRRLGKEAAFMRFPGEPHGMAIMGTPSHRLTRIERVQAWFDDHR